MNNTLRGHCLVRIKNLLLFSSERQLYRGLFIYINLAYIEGYTQREKLELKRFLQEKSFYNLTL